MDQVEGLGSSTARRARQLVLSRRNTLGILAGAVAGVAALPLSRLTGSPVRGRSTVTLEEGIQKGLDLHRQQRYGDAAREFTQLIRSHPDSPDPYLFRGITAYNSGQTRDSITDFSKVLELQPRNAKALLYRGQSYLAVGDRKRAAADFEQVLALAGDDGRLTATARVQLRIAQGAK